MGLFERFYPELAKGGDDWDEDEHPRDEDGKFASRGGNTAVDGAVTIGWLGGISGAFAGAKIGHAFVSKTADEMQRKAAHRINQAHGALGQARTAASDVARAKGLMRVALVNGRYARRLAGAAHAMRSAGTIHGGTVGAMLGAVGAGVAAYQALKGDIMERPQIADGLLKSWLGKADWNESEHPRDESGRFVDDGGPVSVGASAAANAGLYGAAGALGGYHVGKDLSAAASARAFDRVFERSKVLSERSTAKQLIGLNEGNRRLFVSGRNLDRVQTRLRDFAGKAADRVRAIGGRRGMAFGFLAGALLGGAEGAARAVELNDSAKALKGDIMERPEIANELLKGWLGDDLTKVVNIHVHNGGGDGRAGRDADSDGIYNEGKDDEGTGGPAGAGGQQRGRLAGALHSGYVGAKYVGAASAAVGAAAGLHYGNRWANSWEKGAMATARAEASAARASRVAGFGPQATAHGRESVDLAGRAAENDSLRSASEKISAKSRNIVREALFGGARRGLRNGLIAGIAGGALLGFLSPGQRSS